MLHAIQHALEDTWLMLPLLYISYTIIEYFERKDHFDGFLFNKLQKYGPFLGAFIGIIPQCGFSIIASVLFLNHYLTLGTLISVFIATSDEAIPILISNPSLYSSIIWIIIIKIGLGMIIGYIVDKIIYPNQKIISFKDIEAHKTCFRCYPRYPLWISSLFRTFKIFIFLFFTTFVLNIIIHEIGENTLKKILLTDTLFQPILASVFGFIPNCMASVILTQLYVAEQLSFASLISGLISNAGLGIVMLIRYQAPFRDLIRVISILFVSSVLCGISFQLLL